MSPSLSDLALSPEDATELYRLIGRALWANGSFEFQVAYYIVIVLKSPHESMESAETALEDAVSMTMGNLLREFRKCATIDIEFDRRLACFKEERDWLCHRIYRQSHTAIFSTKSLQTLFARLDDYTSEAKSLATILDHNFDLWRIKNGVSDDLLEIEIRKNVEKWKFS